MSLPIWITPAGLLGTSTERELFNATVRVQNDAQTVFSLISGELPPGISLLKTGKIYGTPIPAGDNVTFTFTVRAQNNYGITDRTFSILRIAETTPTWVTPSGPLQLGTDLIQYVVNFEPIEYQLEATHDALPVGQSLRFYLEELTLGCNPVIQRKSLPPGLTLTESGLITGIVNDNLTIPIAIGIDTDPSESGEFDSEIFDEYPLDHDENAPGTPFPKIYQFTVVVTDGNVKASRDFSILVYSADNLQSSTTYITADADLYTTDVSSVNIPPTWLTPVLLDPIRSNNNVAILLAHYDPYNYLGMPTYESNIVEPHLTAQTGFLTSTESDNVKNSSYLIISNASAPVFPKMYFQLEWQAEQRSKTIYRILTVEPYNTGYKLKLGLETTYKGILSAVPGVDADLSMFLPGEMFLDVSTNSYVVFTGTFINVGSTPVEYVDYTLESFVQNNQTVYIGPVSRLPLNFKLDSASGTIIGSIPFQPMYDMNYKFLIGITKVNPITSDIINRVYRYFTLPVKSEYDIKSSFVDYTNLGVYPTNKESQIAVAVTSNIHKSYSIIDGQLPRGMTLLQNGMIIGEAQYTPVLEFTGQWQPQHLYLVNQCFKHDNVYYQVEHQATSPQTFTMDTWFVALEFDDNGIDLKPIPHTYTFTVKETTQSRVLTSNDGVSRVLVASGGSGYPSNTTVTISLPDIYTGRPASASCTVVDTKIGAVNVLDPGTGYIYNPVISFSYTPDEPAVTYAALTADENPEFTKQFTLDILCHPFKEFTKIYASPMMPRSVALSFKQMLTDSNIFDKTMLYRADDPAFGLQLTPKMYIEYGIEQIDTAVYYQNLERYFYNKQLRTGSVKVLKAYDHFNVAVYDLVYLEVIDPMQTSENVSLPAEIVVGSTTVYPNSISNIKTYLESIKILDDTIIVDNSMQPDFVNTLQLRTAFNFILAIPLAYTQPDLGVIIASRIARYNFNFSSINFVIDRLVTSSKQYIRFDDR